MGKVAAVVSVLASALLVASAGSAATLGAGASPAVMYTVAFTSDALPANVDQLVADAGGTIVVRIPQIGGIGVVSSNPGFQAAMSAVASVADASRSAATSLQRPVDTSFVSSARTARRRNRGTGGVGVDPQPEPDPLGAQQWDKMRMNVSSTGSYAVTTGDHAVKVALTDTGVDVNHPDIAANLDLMESRNFITFGADLPMPVPGDDTIQDYNGHGTWTASAVAAPINGVGISGVAPNVSIVELKTNDALGQGNLIDWDNAVVYAGDNHFAVLSSSIYTFVETCRNDASRKHGCDDSDLILAQRAVDYARQRGVTIVGATGNENIDISDQRLVASPFGVATATEVPAGLDGVIGVDATGYNNEKSFYASYGRGIVDVTAPGGDSVTQPAPAPYLFGGRVVGAWSSTALPSPTDARTETSCNAAQTQCGLYAWMQGTSMSTPDVAGVAALIVSRFGSHLGPDSVAGLLEQTANAQSCPEPRMVTYPFPPETELYAASTALCQGGPRDNGFYGSGIVDAFAALTGGERR